MARKKVTPEQWAEAKALWESDDKISYADIGTSLGLSKQAVGLKAKEEKWQKRMDMPKVVNRAHQMADRASIDPTLPLATFALRGGSHAPLLDGPAPKKGIPPPGGAAPGVEHVDAEAVEDMRSLTLEERADAIAVAKRAEILTRHRTEVNAARNLSYEAMRTKNFDMGKLAKISAEALNIIHGMERKAWGLDKGDGDTPHTIIIERG